MPLLIVSEESCRKVGRNVAVQDANGISIADAGENTPLGATEVTVAEWWGCLKLSATEV